MEHQLDKSKVSEQRSSEDQNKVLGEELAVAVMGPTVGRHIEE